MILQESPNKVSCLPTALAMCLGKPVAEILEIIGHNGLEILWPELESPRCFRGFYDQEIVDACLVLGFSCTQVEATCEVSPDGVRTRTIDRREKLRDYLKIFDGIITGHSKQMVGHAVAWDSKRQLVFDPKGFRITFSDFEKDFIVGSVMILKSFE